MTADEEAGAPVVLVVDDDLDIREVLGILLRQHGYHVIFASNGADALQLARAKSCHPALILLDMRMPVMNGWQFLEEHARDPACSATPVAVFSADRSEAARRGVPGVAAFLRKPLDFDEVLQTVARLVAAG